MPGALVAPEQVRPRARGGDGEGAWYAGLPGGQGGRRVQGGRTITIVSPRAPVAAALRGLEAGDVGANMRRGEEIEVEVVEVS